MRKDQAYASQNPRRLTILDYLPLAEPIIRELEEKIQRGENIIEIPTRRLSSICVGRNGGSFMTCIRSLKLILSVYMYVRGYRRQYEKLSQVRKLIFQKDEPDCATMCRDGTLPAVSALLYFIETKWTDYAINRARPKAGMKFHKEDFTAWYWSLCRRKVRDKFEVLIPQVLTLYAKYTGITFRKRRKPLTIVLLRETIEA